MNYYHGVHHPHESGAKLVKNLYARHIKPMSEETQVHQVLKVVQINSILEQMQKTIKVLNKQKRRILDTMVAHNATPTGSQNK